MNKAESRAAEILTRMGFWVKAFCDMQLSDPKNCFYSQFPLRNMRLDFALPNARISIEVNGDYWHGRRTKNLSAQQATRQICDLRKSLVLTNMGWKLIEISAEDIFRDSGACFLQNAVFSCFNV